MSISVKTTVSVQLEHEDGTPVTAIPLTGQIVEAIQEYLTALPTYAPGGMSASAIEMPLIDLGWAVIRALGLSEPPQIDWSTQPAAPGRSTESKRRPLSTMRRLRIMFRDGGCCKHCGSTEDLAVDHIIPVSKGGADADENLQTLCRTCNSAKGDRMPEPSA